MFGLKMCIWCPGLTKQTASFMCFAVKVASLQPYKMGGMAWLGAYLRQINIKTSVTIQLSKNLHY